RPFHGLGRPYGACGNADLHCWERCAVRQAIAGRLARTYPTWARRASVSEPGCESSTSTHIYLQPRQRCSSDPVLTQMRHDKARKEAGLWARALAAVSSILVMENRMYRHVAMDAV